MTLRPPPVLRQLTAAGYDPYLENVIVSGQSVTFTIRPVGRALLARDSRFAHGGLHALHADIGDDLIDCRSYNGTFGSGSLQVVVDKTTGKGYADLDGHNPYQDVARFLGHTFGEVVPHAIVGWFHRKKKTPPKEGDSV